MTVFSRIGSEEVQADASSKATVYIRSERSDCGSRSGILAALLYGSQIESIKALKIPESSNFETDSAGLKAKTALPSDCAALAHRALPSNEPAATEESEESTGTNPGAEITALTRLSCRDRKRLLVPSGRVPKLTKAMRSWISQTHALLDPFREDNDCWLHPSPPAAQMSASGIPRPCGKIQKAFSWQDRRGKHSLVLNYGIVSKLVNYTMTKQQKDGFINEQWHLSHLCGNWTCLNPAHTIVEPGVVNLSRNSCFSHRAGCLHSPPCMKEKKTPLDANGKLIDYSCWLGQPVTSPKELEGPGG